MGKISLDKLSLIVKQGRKAQGKSQQELGELTGINYQMIGRLENGTFVPSIKQIESLMEVLNFDYDDIMEEESNKKVFMAMMGEAKTPEEKEGFERMVSMMLCLRKHERLRRMRVETSQRS